MNNSNPHKTALTEGLVYRSTGSWYRLRDPEGNFLDARIPGKMKTGREIAATNPLAAGDRVLFSTEAAGESPGVIREILPRKNYMLRISPRNRHQKHIIAANIDLALVVATLSSPRTSQGFIDRFLVTAEAYHIPACIVINKTDLHGPAEAARLDEWIQMYTQVGYPVIPVSVQEQGGIEQLASVLAHKLTLFSGHSGTGKTSLINLLIPGLDLRTGEISSWSGKGMHTTTFAARYDLPGNAGGIIDTPGIKEFGLTDDIAREELSHYFPEMRPLLTGCRFNNCLHLNEPGCAVQRAVEEGSVHEDRFISYLSMLESISAT